MNNKPLNMPVYVQYKVQKYTLYTMCLIHWKLVTSCDTQS